MKKKLSCLAAVFLAFTMMLALLSPASASQYTHNEENCYITNEEVQGYDIYEHTGDNDPYCDTYNYAGDSEPADQDTDYTNDYKDEPKDENKDGGAYGASTEAEAGDVFSAPPDLAAASSELAQPLDLIILPPDLISDIWFQPHFGHPPNPQLSDTNLIWTADIHGTATGDPAYNRLMSNLPAWIDVSFLYTGIIIGPTPSPTPSPYSDTMVPYDLIIFPPPSNWQITVSVNRSHPDLTERVTNEVGFYVYVTRGFRLQSSVRLPVHIVDVSPLNPLSGDAHLSGLTVSEGTLNPSFAVGTQEYTLDVPGDADEITVTPTARCPRASVVVSGNYSSLVPGPNTITITVTAENGTTIRLYTITVNRCARSSDATLSSLALSTGTTLIPLSPNIPLTPDFCPTVFEYTAYVPRGTSTIIVAAETNCPKATVVGYGLFALLFDQHSNNAYHFLTVTAENGNKQVYNITITRLPLGTHMLNVSNTFIGLNQTLPPAVTGQTPSGPYATGQEVRLYRGTAEDWVFVGWDFSPDEAPPITTGEPVFASGVLPSAIRQEFPMIFHMPDSDLYAAAMWQRPAFWLVSTSAAINDGSLSGAITVGGNLTGVITVAGLPTGITYRVEHVYQHHTSTLITRIIITGTRPGAGGSAITGSIPLTVTRRHDDLTMHSMQATLTLNVNLTPISNIARLSALSINGVPLPDFDPDETEYTVEVPYTAKNVTVAATAAQSATVAGVGQHSLDYLYPYENTITVTVTAEDRITEKTYTIDIIRGPLRNVTIANEPRHNVTGQEGAGLHKYGRTVSLMPGAVFAHEFYRWEVAGLTITGNEFVMPNENVSITALWDELDITFDPKFAELTDMNLSAAVTVRGSAEGKISVYSHDLPAGIDYSINQQAGKVTITASRTMLEDDITDGEFEIVIERDDARGAVSNSLRVLADLNRIVLPSSDASLASLTVDGADALPYAAAAPGFIYNARYYADSVELVWSTNAAVSSVYVAGYSETSPHKVSLNAPGTATAITIVVTAEDGVTKAKYTITVNRAAPPADPVVTSIAVTTQPDILTYTAGQALDLSGLAVTLTYKDTTARLVEFADFAANGLMASPAHGTPLTANHNGKPIVIAHTASRETASTYNLTVGAAPVMPTITSANTLQVQAGAAGSLTIAADGTAPIAFSLEGAPEGVSISGNQLTIASTVAVGLYNFTIIASNLAGSSLQSFTLNVDSAQITAHIVTFIQPSNGILTASVNGAVITSGQEAGRGNCVVFTVSYESGFRVASWSVNGIIADGQHGTVFTHSDLQSAINVAVVLEPVEQVQNVSIMFDPAAGILREAAAITAYTIPQGLTMREYFEYKNFAEAGLVPSRAGYRFGGWIAEDGELFTVDTPITATDSITVTAVWSRIQPTGPQPIPMLTPLYEPTPEPTPAPAPAPTPASAPQPTPTQASIINVEFNPDRGVLQGSAAVHTLFAAEGSTLRSLGYRNLEEAGLIPVSDRYFFAGWQMDDGSRFTIDTPLRNGDYLTANWIILDDVTADDWYYSAVKKVVANGLLHGTRDSLFEPYISVSRAAFAQVLANLADIDTYEMLWRESLFADIVPGNRYNGAVNWAARMGICPGIGNGLFAPEMPITREVMAGMLYNFARVMGVTLPRKDVMPFADQGEVSPWADGAVRAIQAAGIIQGRGSGFFDPQATATRAEAAAIFALFLQVSE